MKIKVVAIPECTNGDHGDYILNSTNDLEVHPIANQSWVKYKSNDSVNFAIAHDHTNLIIKFNIREKYLQAAVRPINGNIHKDNCVEVFIAFNNDKNYYNFEFNCLGSAKVGYGKSKNGRTMLGEELIKKIKINAVLKLNKTSHQNSFVWEMLIVIPKALFLFSEIETFTGLGCKANFYKCGDGLPEPHYFSWNRIETDYPDFHQPKFFGELIFE